MKLAIAATLCTTTAALADVPKPGTGRGAPSTAPKAQDRVDALFDQGAAAFDAGRYAEAETKLEEVWGLRKTYDVAGNLGVVEVRLGKYPQAAEHLTWALGHFPLTETAKARRGFEQELEKARAQSGALRIRVSVDGAEVLVNGRPVGAAPLADEVFVEPGPASVGARRDGYTPAQQTVTVARGQGREVVLALAPIEVQRRSVVPGVVLGAIAGAALVTGVALIVSGNSKYTEAVGLRNAIVKAGGRCAVGNYDPGCPALYSTASTSDALHDAGVGLLIGAGAAAAGAVTYFLWPGLSTIPRSGSAVQVAPMVSTTGGGAVVWGAF